VEEFFPEVQPASAVKEVPVMPPAKASLAAKLKAKTGEAP